MPRVKLDLQHRDVANKVEFGRKVVLEMTTNAATFVSPLPTLAELTTASDDLETAFENSQKGLLSTAELNEAEVLWDIIMTAMGNYVESVARGSRGVINKAGMEATDANHTAVLMTKVLHVEGRTGAKTGEVFFSWDKVKGCRVYRGWLMPENGSQAQKKEVFTTKTKITITGLDPGVKYLLVLEAIGASGLGPASDSASAYAAF
jgi:hypothetical protein